MIPLPSLTPFEAIDRIGTFNTPSGEITSYVDKEGWRYYMDGPQGSPKEYWAPVAEKDGHTYHCDGEPGDPVTPQSTWVLL